MKITNSTYLQIPSDDTVIWRYFDFSKFVSLLYDKSLWFGRVDILSDQYEGELPHENANDFVYKLKYINPNLTFNERLDKGMNEIKNVRKFKSYSYVNSWTMNKDESFALWKIYLKGNKQGIAIKSTVGKIRKCFIDSRFEGVIGKINYANQVNEVNQDLIIGTKKPYYEYEKEFRIMIQNYFDIEKDEYGNESKNHLISMD